MRLKYWLALAGLGGIAVARKMKKMNMSMERVNREAREKYPRVTYRDAQYMRKVRERMMLGDDCTHPPLYRRGI